MIDRDIDSVRATLDAGTHVGTIEFTSPPNNYLNGDSLARSVAAAQELREAGARAIVLCSEGKNFCAGADFSNLSGRGDVYELGIALVAQPLPIIAAVQGAAVGGGVGLAMSADLRVAGPSSYFWVNFARLGLHHGFGLTETLTRTIGESATVDILYRGNRLSGADAHRIGLCTELVDDDRIRSRAVEIAGEIAANAPLAVQSIRATLRGDLPEKMRAAMAHERAKQEELMGTADFIEGTTALRERRTPGFIGR
ncbi:enoyl-CoA hydratase/isomerase family protein [Gordonia pseudamarae]|jgi:2-(1,2-epoxy-1,2-dihydrophenyl)acetyl-CoA isomerase|uniref:Enoyl-CoA hydratase/isomerase family protein n=1 Tax=Gordonia pseudamarae TaxID=2831662 RepID=A0ABX6IFY7_9ACTN|nr:MULTISPECIES: enoyl-CoA hydratase/isomerase family protein [Gordonia]MBD0021606.1 enoyl-CoA hydratase/isomerase family protein [Gordonia sp. (in: high G+C Gram-positive bacteria)]QHN25113.1 enoyl-CoA hydratase/isomerase family protein [Gordonia pseudamarae]QHN34046.1 enoyl-CoA hydratase/isomerase family protein [Gordonia pseudamarae]